MSPPDDGVPTSPSADGGAAPAAPTTVTCPLAACQCGVTTWLDTQAYCGDNVRLRCAIWGYPPDGPATVEILNNETVVGTLDPSPNMVGGSVQATWVAKAPSADWRTVRLRFRVTAAGVTCTSSNEFTFRQRPTTAWRVRNVPHDVGRGYAPVTEHHDSRLEIDRLHYNMKLLTDGDPFTAAKKQAAKALIERVWNNGFSAKKFHRVNCRRGDACDCQFDCCKAGFRFDVNFVDSGQHMTIHIHAWDQIAPYPPCSQGVDAGDWTDPPRPADLSPYAHEVGHLLGQYDEYSTGAYDPTYNAAHPDLLNTQPPSAGGNLMGDLSLTLLNRHYRYARDFLNANSGGDNYKIIPP